MNFCERLKEIRRKSPYTQKQIAEILSISITAYQYYESGRSQPSIEGLIKLADLFGVTIDYLVGRSESNDD